MFSANAKYASTETEDEASGNRGSLRLTALLTRQEALKPLFRDPATFCNGYATMPA